MNIPNIGFSCKDLLYIMYACVYVCVHAYICTHILPEKLPESPLEIVQPVQRKSEMLLLPTPFTRFRTGKAIDEPIDLQSHLQNPHRS
jgi:hypothetical protein